jgi:hypothetical protein
MISRFQPLWLIRMFLIFLPLFAVSYWLNPNSWHHLSIAADGLFAASFLALVVLIVVMRNRMYLRLDEQGLEIQFAVGAPRSYKWADIDSVSIVRIQFLITLASSIRLQLRPGVRPANIVDKATAAIIGPSVSFPAFFDETAEEIVEKIEMFKRRSLN